MLVGDDAVAERLEALHRQWPHLMDLAGDPHRDEREELQVAVPEGLDQPRPDGPPTSCAAEPHLPRERGEEASVEEGERGVLDDGPEVEPV